MPEEEVTFHCCVISHTANKNSCALNISCNKKIKHYKLLNFLQRGDSRVILRIPRKSRVLYEKYKIA